MARALEPLFSVQGPKVIQVVCLEAESPWRRHPGIVDWIVPLIDATCEKAKATRSVRRRAIEWVLDAAGSYYFDSSDLAGPTVTLGVSASHEAGATYVAFSEEAVAIDSCSSDRAGEILSGGRIVFSREELAMLVSERSLVAGWCAVECLCKLWAAGLFQPFARPQLLSTRPMSAESTEFGSVRNVEGDRARRDLCVWATKTAPTWTKGVVSPWEK